MDLLAGFAAQLDDKMRCLWMERANIECHSLAAPDFLLFQTVDSSKGKKYVNFLCTMNFVVEIKGMMYKDTYMTDWSK